MSQVRNARNEFSTGSQHAQDLAKGCGLILKSEMLEDIQQQDHVKAVICILDLQDIAKRHKLAFIIQVNSSNIQSNTSHFLHKNPLTTTRIQNGCVLRKLLQEGFDNGHLS